MSEAVRSFSAADLAPEKLETMGLVLVDFWAEWCGPCRMLAPVIDEVAQEMKGEVTVGKLNIDDYTDFAIGLGIVSIPTLILFNGSRQVARVVGVQPKEAVLEMIRRAM